MSYWINLQRRIKQAGESVQGIHTLPRPPRERDRLSAYSLSLSKASFKSFALTVCVELMSPYPVALRVVTSATVLYQMTGIAVIKAPQNETKSPAAARR